MAFPEVSFNHSKIELPSCSPGVFSTCLCSADRRIKFNIKSWEGDDWRKLAYNRTADFYQERCQGIYEIEYIFCYFLNGE